MNSEFLDHLSSRPSTSPLPTWTPSFAIALFIIKHTFNLVKDSVAYAQSTINKLIHPKPGFVKLEKVLIPRRCLDLGHDFPSLKPPQEPLKAEFVDWQVPLDALLDPQPDPQQAHANERVVLFAHGGGYALCSRKTHRGLTWRLSKYAKARVLAIDYRLSPQHVFPAALQDMLSAYLFLIDPPPTCKKYDPLQITLCGDSAGGNLALVTALWLRDSDYPLPGNLVLLSPWLDLTHSNPSFKLNHPYDYLPDQSVDTKYIHASRKHYCISDNSFLQHPLVSPLFADPVGKRPLPRTLIQIGDAEKLRDEALVFFERFKSSDIIVEMYEDMIHVFQLLASMDPFAKTGLQRAGHFVKDSQNGRSCTWIRRSGEHVEMKQVLKVIEWGHAQLKSVHK